MHLDDNALIMTNHARQRAQVRGIPMRLLEAIYANADRSPFVVDGRRSLMVSRRKLSRLAASIPATRPRAHGGRVASKQELKERIMAGIQDVNCHPVIHTWSYKLADAV